MFTRFFGKSSFFNYTLILALFVGVFFFQISTAHSIDETQFQRGIQFGTFFVLFFLFFGLDWIVRIQYWNEKGVYHLFLFSFFFFLAPHDSIKAWHLLSLFFFWIGFIQILRLDKKNNFTKSVFNAALWMTISGLFINTNFFLFPLLWGILFCYNKLSTRSFLISLFPGIALFILGHLVEIFVPIQWFKSFAFFEFQWNFPSITSLNQSVLLCCILILFFLVLRHHYRSFSQKGKQYLSSIFSLFLVFFGSLGFALFIDAKGGASFLLIALSFSALSGSYLERIKRKWIRELILIVLLVVGIYYKAGSLGLELI